MLLKDKLNLLNEQLTFLLEKNKELKVAQEGYFNSVLPIIENKLNNKELNEKTIADLKEIQEILKKDQVLSMTEFDEDLAFLQEQIIAVSKIKEIEDQAKAEEILNMMFDAEFELSDTKEFKEKINSDFEVAKTNLNLLLQELKEAIEAEDLTEIKLLMQTNLQEMEDDCHGDCDDDCCSECDSDEGVDLFKDIAEFTDTLEKEAEQESCSSCCGCKKGCCSDKRK